MNGYDYKLKVNRGGTPQNTLLSIHKASMVMIGTVYNRNPIHVTYHSVKMI